MEKRGHNNQGLGSRLKRLLQGFQSLARRAPRPAVKQTSSSTNRPPAVASPATAGRILIVELGGWTCGSLPTLLSQDGYETQVVCGREAALGVLEPEDPVLLIVGGTADPDLYRALCRVSSAPILALVPEGDGEQAVAAFAAGVDQYQAGYISSGEAVARARAMLRRTAWPALTLSDEV